MAHPEEVVKRDPAEPADSNDPSTSKGPWWTFLEKDLPSRVLALSGALVLAAYFLPFLDTTSRELLASRWLPFGLIGLTITTFLAGGGRLSKGESRFWQMLALGFVFLWAASFARLFFAEGAYPLPIRVSTELLYTLFYLLWILAIEALPHRRERQGQAREWERVLTWPGAIIFVFGLLIYFVLIPLAFDRQVYSSWIPSLALRVALDGYLAGRLLVLASAVRERRWKGLYLLLAMASGALLLADLYAILVQANPQRWRWGTPWGWCLALTPFLIWLLAARARLAPIPRSSTTTGAPQRRLPSPRGRWQLIFFTFAFPLIHLVSYGFGLLDSASQSKRDMLVLTWLLGLGSLALIQHLQLERRSRSLWDERTRAQEKLERSNRELSDSLAILKRLNRTMVSLQELGERLLSCQSRDEASLAIASSLADLFPRMSGAICTLDPTGKLGTFAAWGRFRPGSEPFDPQDCLALRQPIIHAVDWPQGRQVCHHLRPYATGAALCLPLSSRGEDPIGVFYVYRDRDHPSGADQPVSQSEERLAATVASHVGMALSNLDMQASLRTQAIRDPLTRLFNRRFMTESLQREVRRARRRAASLGIVLLDIDHFKRFNDTHGHPAGDAVLCVIGEILRTSVRGEDLACRYGGEEFVVILLDASPKITYTIAEKIRWTVAQQTAEPQTGLAEPVTVSLGAASFPSHGASPEQLLEAADQALYQAKAAGRNCAALAKPAAKPLIFKV